MPTRPLSPALAILLAALAGFVDALAFTSAGGFFAAFMSGNSTRLGAGIARGSADAVVAGALVLSFVSGAILAAVIARAAGARRVAAGAAAVTALLVGAGVAARFAPGPLPLLALATAMGAGHLLLRQASGAAGLTDALVRLGERLAGALMEEGDRWGWLPHLLRWAGFVAGVVLGAGAALRLGLGAYWIAAFAAGALAIVTAGWRGPAGAAAR